MSEVSCIYDMSLISEGEHLRKDIISGKALDIAISLLGEIKSVRELSMELGINRYSTQIYLNRLQLLGIVEIAEERISNGRIEKYYRLIGDSLEFINDLGNKSDKDNVNIKLSANHFSNMTRKTIENISQYKEKPHKIKAQFIKIDDAKMEEFKKELDNLFEKFEAMEDISQKTTYALISVFAPYENLNNKGE